MPKLAHLDVVVSTHAVTNAAAIFFLVACPRIHIALKTIYLRATQDHHTLNSNTRCVTVAFASYVLYRSATL